MRMKGRNATIGFCACPSGAVWEKNAWRTGCIREAPGIRVREKRCFLARFRGGVQRRFRRCALSPRRDPLGPEGLEAACLDGATRVGHERQVEVQVVERVRPEREDLPRLEQVPE